MEQSIFIRSFGLDNVKQKKNFWMSFLSMTLVASSMLAVELFLKEENWQIIATALSSSLALMIVTAFRNPGEFPKIVTALDRREEEETSCRFRSGPKNRKWRASS